MGFRAISTTLGSDGITNGKILDANNADSITSFTTVNEDGSRSVYSFAQPVKYWNHDANRVEFIDTDWRTVGLVDSLFSGQAYTNKADTVKVSLPGNLSGGVSLEWSGRATASQELSSSEPAAVSPAAQPEPAADTAVAAKDYTFRMTPASGVSARPTREEGSPFVCYEGAFGAGTRLEYKAVQGGVKENLVLESNPGVNEFSFTLDVPGLVPDVMQGGTIVFYDEQTDSPVVILTQPWAMDSRTAQTKSAVSADGQEMALEDAASEAHSKDVDKELCLELNYRVEPAGEGKYRLTMVVDPEFLNSPSTVYPVTIDPSIFTYASRIPFIMLASDGSRLNTLGSVGSASGIEYLMYCKMPDMHTYKYINPNRVISASVVMTQELASEQRYAVDLHDSNTSVSIAGATYNTVLQGTGSRISTTYCADNGQRYVWDFKALFRAWLGYELQGAGWSSYQFIIKAQSTGMPRKVFNTSEENAFYYVVTYNEETMITDGYYYIRSARNGKYLDHHMAENRTTAWGFDGTPNQRWKVTRHSGNSYSIKPADNLDLALEVYQGLTVNNRPITQYFYDSTLYYQWRIVSNNDGTFRVMPRLSETKGLDIYYGTDTTMTFNGRSFPKRYGIDVQLFEYNGNSNQNWEFVPAVADYTFDAADNNRTMSWQCTYADAGYKVVFTSAKVAMHNVSAKVTKNDLISTNTVTSIESFGYLDNSNPTANDYTYDIQYGFRNSYIMLGESRQAVQANPNSTIVSPGWVYDYVIAYPNTNVSFPFRVTIQSVGTISSALLNIAVPFSYIATYWDLSV